MLHLYLLQNIGSISYAVQSILVACLTPDSLHPLTPHSSAAIRLH